MKLFSGLLRGGVIFAVLAVSSACGPNVQIVRLPFISPVVVPAPEQFKMNVGVKNYSTTQSSPYLYLDMLFEYASNPQRSPCVTEQIVRVGVLAPDQGWGLADFDISKLLCGPCVKDSCSGNVRLKLVTDVHAKDRILGQNTGLQVTWSPAGNLADLRIDEF